MNENEGFLSSDEGTYITTVEGQKILLNNFTKMNKKLRSLGDCVGTYVGSKMGKCNLKSVGLILGVMLVQAGTDISTITTKKGLDKLIKDGVAFPYNDVFDFEQTTPDNPVITSGNGRKSRSYQALPEFTFTYDGGLCLAKSLANKLNGDWDLVLITDKGLVLAENKAGTIIKGFGLQYQDVSSYKFMNSGGTEAESVALMVQFKSASEFNDRMGILLYDNMDYDSAEIEGAEGVELIGDVKAGSDITLEISNVCNYDSKIIGITPEADNFKVNGIAPESVEAVVSGQGLYKLTLATPLIVSSNYVISVNAVDVAGNMYIGYKKGVVQSS